MVSLRVVYRDILENHCLPQARRVYGNNNARAHGAAAVRECLDAEGVQQVPWPACSPDMNPIEQAWDASGRALNEGDDILQSLQESARDVTAEWDALHTDGINKLVDSMPQRLDALIRVRGGHPQYLWLSENLKG